MKRSVTVASCKHATLALLQNVFAPATPSSTIEMILVVLLPWTLCLCSTAQCFFFRPSGGLQSASSYNTQPITLKVPTDKVDDLKQAISTNPEYLKQLIAQSGNSNGIAGPVSVAPKERNTNALSNLPSSPSVSNAYPAFSQGPVTVALPKETTINGQKYYLTTRANMLYSKSANILKNAASTLASPFSPFSAATGCINNVIGLNQITPQLVQNVQTLKTDPKPTVNAEEEEEEEEDDDDEEEIEEIEEVKRIRRPKTKFVTYTKQKKPGNGKSKKTKAKDDSSEEENSEGGSSEGESNASGSDEGSDSGSGDDSGSGSDSVENEKQSPKKAKN